MRRLTPHEHALVHAAQSLADELDVHATCEAALDAAGQLFDARAAWILLHEPSSDCLRTVAFRGPGAESYADVSIPSGQGIVGLAFARGEPVFVPDPRNDDRWFARDRVQRSELHSVLTVPLEHRRERLGVLGLDSPRFTADSPPGEADLDLLRAVAALAAAEIKNAQLFREADEDRRRLQRLMHDRRQLRTQVGQLREEVRDAGAYREVIGGSTLIRKVLAEAEVVAPADTTVLLVGETGTGKELMARAIHERSRRSRSAFVAVNCAALPESLVESELFGHEKGAFTGALARKPGKFELADRGTLFLDEIGDLPAEAQAKLLRVLQEHEVQRVGGVRPVAVNVRVIAATNQNLERLMGDGEFRPDLFYRLSVFPIVLPPLRERRDDIPLLAAHFVRRFAHRLHTPVPQVPDEAMDRLLAYNWPGNIRELQNVIERAVLLARGDLVRAEFLPVPAPLAAPTANAPADPAGPPAPPSSQHDPGSQPDPVAASILSFSEAERRAILRALDLSAWRISGPNGAAELLGLKPTTLHAKMKKLGIRRPSAR